MEWKGLAASFRNLVHIRCALTGPWNGSSVNCSGLLVGPACAPFLALARLSARSANFLAHALACEGWGRGNRMKVAEGLVTHTIKWPFEIIKWPVPPQEVQFLSFARVRSG